MRFSIRDLLLVTVIVAILAAWWIDHRRMTKKAERLREDFSGPTYPSAEVWTKIVESRLPNPSAPKP